MLSFGVHVPSVQSDIENLYSALTNAALNTSVTEKKENVELAERLAAFFKCSPGESIPLCCLIHLHIIEEKTSIDQLIEHFSAKKSDASYLNKLLSVFVEREWISPKKDITVYPLTEYSISMKFMRSVLMGKIEIIDQAEIKNTFDLLQHFKRLLQKRKESRLEYMQLTEAVSSLVTKESGIELARMIKEWELTPADSTQFMYFCMRYFVQLSDPDPDDMIRDLNPPREEQYRLRGDFKYGCHTLIGKGLIAVNKENDLPWIKQYTLTPKVLKVMDSGRSVHFNPEAKILKKVNPENIQESKLIFEGSNHSQVEKLHKIVERSSFVRLQERLSACGMKPGVTLLLCGAPGTGKTETVMQLARKSGRYLFMAEPNEIRSKWVGDTEKNIKELFDEYRRHLQQCEEVPILLFNEADGILGKRMNVKDRGDQMENSLQNIILQELENFEGIFVATTNLERNFDAAFERRFLYKIRFEKPGKRAMAAIWKAKFPALRRIICQNICNRFELTGAQIENIRKKVAVDQVLNERVTLTEKYLMGLIEEEFRIREGERRERIGFK